MTENRFAQLRDAFDEAPKKERAVAKSRKRAAQSAPKGYAKKGRYPFALHEDVRYEKLEDLVAYHGAKSASDYLEGLIIKEWEKLQRKLKNKEIVL